MSESSDVGATGAQVESLLAELGSSADARTYQQVEEIVRLLTQLYGDALERISSIVESEAGRDMLLRLADDDLVNGLLVLHELHPKDTETRVQESLDKVRPYLGSHAGGVELLGVDTEGVAYLRLEGTCDGCPSSAVTVKYAIEGAIGELAPEVTAVEVEGMTDGTEEQPSSSGTGTQSNVIPAESLFFRECPVPEAGVQA